jgi:hypothetical protein
MPNRQSVERPCFKRFWACFWQPLQKTESWVGQQVPRTIGRSGVYHEAEMTFFHGNKNFAAGD